jgi:hypothetical protein
MTTKLTIYNGALLILGERNLASLSEATASRYTLDQIWDAGLLNYCLRQGQWGFATKAIEFSPNSDIEPDFGYQYAYDMPEDWIKAVAICTDDYFNSPLLDYVIEAGVLYCDYNTIYTKYISNGETYGGDFSLWTEDFARFVETYMAWRACERITQNRTKRADLEKDLKQARLIAMSADRSEKATQFPAMGAWASSRMLGGGYRDSNPGNIPT